MFKMILKTTFTVVCGSLLPSEVDLLQVIDDILSFLIDPTL